MLEALSQVNELVERFDQNIEAYRSPSYNETHVRLEFINPLFEVLGWDVTNKAGYAEAYKDVLHEDAIKIGGATKAPDYSFRIGGTRKFFLEAKKPALNLKEEQSPAYQLRRYAWSGKLSLSILTSFAEFAVYDCRLPPTESDKASAGRILYLTYKEYVGRWDEIASVFSKQAVLQGSFDKFGESRKGKRGTSQVDAAFLDEIESWREALARNLALRNAKLSVRDLNFAVQKTIDRIIFLRMCEDRGIEPYGQLQALLNGENVYKRLHYLYGLADAKYNSGLFHFREEKGRAEALDQLTLRLKIDDKILKDIIRRLYYPESPYEFSVLGADILGNVYEQFLGKVIRLTPAHRAVVEEKPEVKKAGGVYYTPSYIVDYIVKNTVGKFCEEKTPKQIAKLKILDPACGSGSFLIGAYAYLLNYHRDSYVKDGPQNHTKQIYRGPGNQWYLTTPEKKRILLNNIYGVDIDTQAVEVTKLSLLLKVLEGESEETINRQLKIWRERALPDLGHNIKCGNSLIGPDFYENQQLTLDEDQRSRINIFDWHTEFPQIMRRGGFDAVIGNPPYVFGEYHDKNTKAYLESKMRSAVGQYDTYWLFIERGIQLTNSRGRFALIVPDALLARDECANVRDLLLNAGLERLFHCGLVFSANVSALVFTVQKGSQPRALAVDTRDNKAAIERYTCSTARFIHDGRKRFLIHASDREAALIESMQKSAKPLREYGKLSRGEELGKKHVLSQGPVPIVVGEDIGRYSLRKPTRFIQQHEKSVDFYRSPKLVIVKTGAQCIATIDMDSLVTMQSVYNLHPTGDEPSLTSILAVLNSRLIAYFIEKTFTAYKLLFPQLNQTTIEEIPIALLNAKQQARIESLVDRMLALHRELAAAKTPHDKERHPREIAAIEHQIDQLVYELYGLTEEEIEIVEKKVGWESGLNK